MGTGLDDIDFFDRQPPQRLGQSLCPYFGIRQTIGSARMNLEVRGAEFSQVLFERVAPGFEDIGRVGVDDGDMLEAVDGQTGRAFGVALQQPIGR